MHKECDTFLLTSWTVSTALAFALLLALGARSRAVELSKDKGKTSVDRLYLIESVIELRIFTKWSVATDCFHIFFFFNRPTSSLKIKRPIPCVNIVLRTFSEDPFLGLSNKDGYHDYEVV